jgi:dolichyl-phosphate-mannose-protein mannosyltransferase
LEEILMLPPQGMQRSLKSHYLLGILLAVALLVRIALMPLWAYLPKDFSDEGFWKDWMLAIHQHGLLNIFHTTTDYVGYHYVLWLLTLVYSVIGSGYGHDVFRLHLLVKAPPVLFDLALIAAVYAVSLSLFEELRVRHSKALALGAAAVVAFQPAIIYDSAVWAQTDSAVTLAMILSLFFVARGRTALGFGVWAIGFLIKPHPIIVLPLLLYLAWRQGAKSLLTGVATGATVGLIALAPWLFHGDGPDIIRIYHGLFAADYNRLSAQAWNLWWFFDITSHLQPAQSLVGFVTFRMAGLLLTACAGLLALLYLRARTNLRGTLVAAAYLAFAFYILPVSTHERYLYPFFAFLLPLVMIEKRWRPLYVMASIAFFLNLAVVAPPIHSFSGRWIGSPFTIGVAALNCLLFAMFTLEMVRVAMPSLRLTVQRRRQWLREMFGKLPQEIPSRGAARDPRPSRGKS